jgi:hypothetical protein
MFKPSWKSWITQRPCTAWSTTPSHFSAPLVRLTQTFVLQVGARGVYAASEYTSTSNQLANSAATEITPALIWPCPSSWSSILGSFILFCFQPFDKRKFHSMAPLFASNREQKILRNQYHNSSLYCLPKKSQILLSNKIVPEANRLKISLKTVDCPPLDTACQNDLRLWPNSDKPTSGEQWQYDNVHLSFRIAL